MCVQAPMTKKMQCLTPLFIGLGPQPPKCNSLVNSIGTPGLGYRSLGKIFKVESHLQPSIWRGGGGGGKKFSAPRYTQVGQKRGTLGDLGFGQQEVA